MNVLREDQMSDPVSAWLAEQGFVVYSEVPWYLRSIDLAGRRDDGELVAVELKMNLSSKLLSQCQGLWVAFNRTYAAVASNPRPSSVARFQKRGIGVLRVAGGRVSVLLEARRREQAHHWQKSMNEMLDQLPSGGVGGRPCLRGQGPAQTVKRLIEEYRAGHPDATWQEMFEAIPNHYAHAKSMQNAMRMLRDRRHWQKIQREYEEKQRKLAERWNPK